MNNNLVSPKEVEGHELWPSNLQFEKLDTSIQITNFPNMEELNREISEYLSRYEEEKLAASPKETGALGGTKIHHIDTWDVAGARLLDERAKQFYMNATGAKSAVVDLSWGNVYRTGDFIVPHAHRRSTGSVVYMVDLGDHSDVRDPFSGKFSIADPRLPICSNESPGIMTNLVVPNMNEGSMIVFPSSVVHFVSPYRGTERARITLSWNINTNAVAGRPQDGELGAGIPEKLRT